MKKIWAEGNVQDIHLIISVVKITSDSLDLAHETNS